MASAAAPTSGQDDSAASFIGALISLTSHSNIRYQGILSNIDAAQATLSLENVHSWGTEGRCAAAGHPQDEVPKNDHVYGYIVFRAADVVDLRIDDPSPNKTGGAAPESTMNESETYPTISAGLPDPQYMMQYPYAPMGPYGPMYQPMPQMYGGFTQETYPFHGGYMMPPYVNAPVYPINQDAGLDVPPHMQGIPSQPPVLGVQPKSPAPPSADSSMQQQIPVSNEVQKSSAYPGPDLESLTETSNATGPLSNRTTEKPLPTTRPSSINEDSSGPKDTPDTNDISKANVSIDNTGSVSSQTKPVVQERKPKTVPGAAPGAVVASRDPSVPESDFDFEKANSLFKKHSGPDAEEPSNNDRITSVPSAPSKSFYDRKTGFFDNISSEVKDRHEGGKRSGREGLMAEEKERNVLTFGDQAANYRGSSRRGRGRGGRGRGRGRGEKQPAWA